VVEIQEEGTRAQAATVIAGACSAHVERMAKERVILLVTTHGEVGEAAQRVSTLYVELRMRPRRKLRAWRPKQPRSNDDR
jgi:hypothetical protein